MFGIYAVFMGVLTVVGGAFWFMYLWTQLRKGRLYCFTMALRNCVRRNMPVMGAVHAVQADRVLSAGTLTGVTGRLAQGVPLAKALSSSPGFFSPDYVALIDLGERTGQLPTILDYLVADLTERRRRRGYLFSRLAYFFVFLAFYGIVITFIMLKVIPKFRDIFAEFEMELSPTSETVIDASNFLTEYGLGTGLVVAAFVLALTFLLLRNLGVWPTLEGLRQVFGWVRGLFGIIRRTELATFAASMSAALTGGATVVEALSLSGRCVRLGPLGPRIQDAVERVKDGQNLADALAATRVFPRTFLWMVRSGEAAGRLPHALGQLQHMYLQRAQLFANFLVAVLVPVMTCLMAGIVLALAWTVLGSEIQLLEHMTGGMP